MIPKDAYLNAALVRRAAQRPAPTPDPAETPVAVVAPAPVPEEVNADFLAVIDAALGSAGLRSRRFWLAVATFGVILAQYVLGNVAAGAALGDLVKTLAIYAAAEASSDIARAASAGIAARRSLARTDTT